MATIKGSDIIQDGHLQNAIKEAQALKKAYEELDAAVLKSNKDLATEVKGNKGGSAKQIQQLNIALSESTKIKTAAQKVDKDKIRLEQQLIGLQSQEIKQNEILKVKISEQRKENKLLARETEGLVNAYDKLVNKTNKAQNEFKRLAAQFGVNSKQAQKAKVAFDGLDKELRQINADAKDGRRDVGRYGTALQGAAGGAKKLLGALGVVGGIQLFARVLKDAFNVVKEFDQSQANLASVLGVSRDSMGSLTEQAKELGATTSFTASNVAELQLEFAKLGFVQKEIEGVTEATLQLAAAAGTELGNAASIVGSTLRGFNMDVDQTQRLVDVMAKSFTSSSLDIEKFSSAMSNVAPAANAVGLSVERTTALIGTLTDAGIDAGSAGTGLRNMFLASIEQGISFEDAMTKISNSTDKLGTSFELFGKKGATLGVVLAENQEGTDKLTASLENSAGAAGEMADKQLDTLGGALDILRSSWEGVILEFNEGSGAGDALKETIIALAEALPAIIGFFTTLSKILPATGAGFFQNITAIGELTNKIKSGTATFDDFSTVVASWAENTARSVPLVGMLIDEIVDLTSETVVLTESQKKNNTINKNAINIGKQLLQQNKDELGDIPILIDALNDENTTREEKEKIIAKLNADYPETLKNIDLETASTEALIQVKKDLIKTMLTQAVEERKAAEKSKIFDEALRLSIAKTGIQDKKRLDELDRKIKEELAGLQMIDAIAERVMGELGGVVDNMDISSPLTDVSATITRLTSQISDLRGQLKGLDPTSEDAKRLQKLLNEKLSDLKTFEAQRIGIIKDGLDEEGNAISGTSSSGSGSGGRVAAGEEVDIEKEKLDKLLALKKKHNLELLQLENDLIKKGVDREMIDQLMFEKQVSQKREQGTLIKQLDFDEKEVLIKHINDYLKFVEKGEIERFAIHEESRQNLEVLDIKYKTKKPTEEEEEEAKRKKQEENFKAAQKTAEETMKLIQTFADNRIAEIDKLIQNSRDEISASENEVNRLQELAGAGNNDAAESLKAEKIQQAINKKEIEELENKKKDLLFKVAMLNQANAFFQAGDSDGFQKALGKGKNFIDSLPTFWEGTETTVSDALGSPHLNTKRDGYIARLDGSEGVFTGEKMDTLRSAGLNTTDQITNAAMRAQSYGMTMGAMGGNTNATVDLVKSLGNEFEKAVKKIEIINNHFDFNTFTETVQKGNTTTRNDYSKKNLQA